jgi:hypothetical protein
LKFAVADNAVDAKTDPIRLRIIRLPVIDRGDPGRQRGRFESCRNVHNASLFPDLNGLATSLRYELETHWAFDPKTGADFPGWGGRRYARWLETSIEE